MKIMNVGIAEIAYFAAISYKKSHISFTQGTASSHPINMQFNNN